MEQFEPGSLVHTRGRDWIVVPSEQEGLLNLRPLTIGAAEEAGLFLGLERAVQPAVFPEPARERFGDAASLIALFSATRLSLRSGAAPFRSLGQISVTPRPYQFVPLLMALRLATVRLLVADDVGVGKTIEAALIARELLDRGIARRLAVICPAHLCDQWARELEEKFALAPDVIQPSTVARLERRLPRRDLSIYEWPRCFVASIDFVKSQQQRDRLLRHLPDLVIVDEAHMAARPRSDRGRAQQQRHELLRAIAEDAGRHLILVTATPHSGIEESFRSLLGLLDPSFDRPGGPGLDRKQLRPHIVQRRRRDVERWMGAETPFPERVAEEVRYTLSPRYARLFTDVLEYCRETAEAGESLGSAQRRVRHWAMIALLRCLLSSPAAAVSVLSGRLERIVKADEKTADDPGAADAVYRPQVLDDLADAEASDYTPGGPFEDDAARWSDDERARLRRFAERARALIGRDDTKLETLSEVLRGLLDDGYQPIVFCRFIQTARHVADQLPRRLGRAAADVDIRAVTGELGDEERREKIAELGASRRRILVATDCLSEGINLQDHFDAVVHYDLPWNPNRLEQREGRIDRFGQRRPVVKTVVLYGANNEVDHAVLEVLLRKARAIQKSLGIAVPVPAEAEQVIDAVIERVLLHGPRRGTQLELGFGEAGVSELHAAWDRAAEREKSQRAFYSQSGIQPEEVARELEETDDVLGERDAARRFLEDALQRFDGSLKPASRSGTAFDLQPGTLVRRLRPLVGDAFPLRVTLDRQKDESGIYLGRTHPLVEAVADAVVGEAFKPGETGVFSRAGAILTDLVDRTTTLLLLRFRYTFDDGAERFAEEVRVVGFERDGGALRWLEPLKTRARELAETARPIGNLEEADKRHHVDQALEHLRATPDWFRPLVDWRVQELEDAHARLRRIAKASKLRIKAHEPPDIMACCVLIPVVRSPA